MYEDFIRTLESKFELSDSFIKNPCNTIKLNNGSSEAFNLGLVSPIIWTMEIETRNFKLITPLYGFDNIKVSSGKSFLNLIRPCFRNYFLNILMVYIENLTPSSINNSSLQCLLPMRLENSTYFLSLLICTPVIDQGKWKLYFNLLPCKEYALEPISINMLRNNNFDFEMTRTLKNKVKIEQLFTSSQYKIFELLQKGYSSREIGTILYKNHDNILKFNTRIKKVISDFFEMDFPTAKEAVNYYNLCFL